MGTSIQRPLDHPFFCTRDSDDRACVLGRNNIGELCFHQPTGLKEAYWAVGLEYTHHNSGYH